MKNLYKFLIGAGVIALIIGFVILMIILFVLPDDETTITKQERKDNTTKNADQGTYTIFPNYIGQAMPCVGQKVLPNSDPSKHCVVSADEAPKLCQELENCGGYAITTNAAWNAKFPSAAAQLIDKNKPYSMNYDWTVHKLADKLTVGKNYKFNFVNKKIGQGPFTCPTFTHSKSDASSQCIVQSDVAQKLCQSMENCGGYGMTTNFNHFQRFPVTFALFDKNKPLVDNSEWSMHVKTIN